MNSEKPERLTSLDAFRGATIAAMILVNDPGGGESYAQLQHAAWHGWTFTDWIFPFFLWIVGVAMTFSFARRLQEGGSRRVLMIHLFRRALIIFALGLFVNGFPFGLFGSEFSLATWRIPGVLQRIAICYLIAGIIALWTNTRGQIIWIVALLAVYWLLVKLVPVPGYGAGILMPLGCLEWYLDSTLLAGHTWVWAPVPGFDPEGIVSTLPAIATALLGIGTGNLLRSGLSRQEKTVWMFVAGVFLLLLGVIAAAWMPINKQLWTPSFVIFMAGWANICLAVFYWFIDVLGFKRWSMPFVILGMNAIALYIFSECLATLLWVIGWTGGDGVRHSLHEVVYSRLFSGLAQPVNASLMFAIAFVLVSFLVAWVLWRKRVFLRV